MRITLYPEDAPGRQRFSQDPDLFLALGRVDEPRLEATFTPQALQALRPAAARAGLNLKAAQRRIEREVRLHYDAPSTLSTSLVGLCLGLQDDPAPLSADPAPGARASRLAQAMQRLHPGPFEQTRELYAACRGETQPDAAALLDCFRQSMIQRVLDTERHFPRSSPQVLSQPSASLRLAQSISTLSTVAAWNIARVVYRLDPDFEQALCATPCRTLPTALLRRLPHRGVVIELREPRVISLGTHQASIGSAFVQYVLDEEGSLLHFVLITEQDVLPLPLRLGGQIEDAVGRLTFDHQPITAARLEAFTNLLTPFLNVLLYLCSDRADVQPAPPAAERPHQRRSQTVTQELLGWRVGAALRSAREHHTRPPQGQHASPLPHMRAAHWKVVWHGPRRDPYPVSTWIAPSAVLGGGEERVIRDLQAPAPPPGTDGA